MQNTLEEIGAQVRTALQELLERGGVQKGGIVVIGCSSSEVGGGIIGKNGSLEIAGAIYTAAQAVLTEAGVFLAAQCCEHLNRAIVVEQAAVSGQETVCAVPKMHAGGSFATVTYQSMQHPVLVESIRADAGLDIGGTLIGMHLKQVAVPLRLSVSQIGCALLLAAYTRPKYIGGERAQYK